MRSSPVGVSVVVTPSLVDEPTVVGLHPLLGQAAVILVLRRRPSSSYLRDRAGHPSRSLLLRLLVILA